MNELEKRSFYSFLGLYLVSSFLFIALTGYWYYSAQKTALERNAYYRLQHFADTVAGTIIMAHMHGTALRLPPIDPDVSLAFIDTEGRTVQGKTDGAVTKAGYHLQNGRATLVSDAPQEHLGIRYIVLRSATPAEALKMLRDNVLFTMTAVALLISMLTWVLARLFMRPLRQRIEQIERFVNDIAHELNTPVTALGMSVEQVAHQGTCSEKTLRNITVSTRQLHDIYRALTYLNFAQEATASEPIDLETVLRKSIAYYAPLCDSKRIILSLESEPTPFAIPESLLQLLFGNLIGNAVKYSPPGGTVSLTLKKGCFCIEDRGIGIPPARQEQIFKPYTRGTNYAGGFGVGLNIVKRICDDYGISLSLESAPREGTLFRLCFPGD